jgi:uncharacterized protein
MRKLAAIILLTIGMAGCFSAYSQQPYELQRDVKIPMRDGISLSADVVIPKDVTQTTVVLVVNCYPTEQANSGMHQFAARGGFVLVEVANRGKAKSEGEFIPFRNDAQDNYDIIDWISKQPWCNGKVVMGGGSYLGFTQWAAAKMNHPALKAIAPMVAAAPGIDFPMHNNVFSGYSLRWANYVTNNRYTDRDIFLNNRHWYPLYNRYYSSGLAFNSLDTLDGKPKAVFQQWLQHPAFDSYWSETIPSKPADFNKIDIPVLTITGFFDGDQRGALYYYTNHLKYGTTTAANNHYLIIGPYDHAGAQSLPHRRFGDYVIDSAAIVDMRFVCLQWFAHTANNKAKPPLLKDKVNCFVMGSGWKHAASLSQLAPDTLSFSLQSSGSNKFHQLAALPGKGRQSVTISFNSFYRMDSIDVAKQDSVFNYENTKSFTNDYLNTPQSLFFDTAPLDADYELIGSPVAELNMEFKRIEDCDLKILYYEITPDGKSYPLSSQYQRMSYHHDRTKRSLLSEGKVYRFTFDNSYFIGKRIAKGSKIRFVVSVINSAALQKNYGSGKDVSKETIKDARTGTIKLLMDTQHRSAIYLPGKKS